jgi:hypothetical protein
MRYGTNTAYPAPSDPHWNLESLGIVPEALGRGSWVPGCSFRAWPGADGDALPS